MEQQQHEMILDTTHASGAEEWLCPTCGKRMMINWHPWKKIVLEQGDIYAAHSASKGGLRIGALGVSEGDNGDPISSVEPTTEDPYLAPWQEWLDKVDLDSLGNGND